jgi:UDP-N-acetylglucosamine 2-epimerase (hydrolysing)
MADDCLKPRRILFLTGTRADFGKLKPLIRAVDDSPNFSCAVFATGMHTLKLYGYTAFEVLRQGYSDVHVYMNQLLNEPMEQILSNTISGLSRYVHENRPDMIVVHGDRVEAMAGAVVGALQNILVAHIEGGELSGTIDELIRHSISKMSHLHFVANEDSARRLTQMGEAPESVFVIGSPDIDVMLGGDLPSLDQVKAYYEIDFSSYAIALYHPVTTEVAEVGQHARNFVQALIESNQNYVVVYPNNDEGTSSILAEYKRLEGRENFALFPSIRFESFLTLMKHARFVIGNSSAGIHEAPIMGVPTVNIGSRQMNRFTHHSIINAGDDTASILQAIAQAQALGETKPTLHFGRGNSHQQFMEVIQRPSTWAISKQKQFRDLAAVPLAPTGA